MARFLFVLLILSGFFLHSQNSTSSGIGKLLGKSLAEDNPHARLEFEKLRTRNPKSGKIPENIYKAELQYYNNRLKNASGKARILDNLSGWKNRGPFNVGGRTRALAIDIANEEVLLAGGVSGGMWRSINGGASWEKTTGSNELQSVTAIAQDPRSGQTNIWYYTTGEFSGNSASAPGAFYFGNGIFKSTNGGQSWIQLSSTVTGNLESFDQCFDINHEIAVSPTDGTVFVANFCGIFVSADGGGTFEQVYDSPGNGGWSDVVVDSAGRAYAFIKEDGVLLSEDNGENWENISSEDFPNFRAGDRGELAIAPSNENIAYLLAEAPTLSGHTLWRYDSETGIWVDRTDGIPLLGGFTGDFDSQGGYDLFVKVKPDDENFVVIGGINLFRSKDGFQTENNTIWIGGYTPTNNTFGIYANHHPDQHALVFYPSNPNQALSGNDGGVQFTEDIRTNFSEILPVTWTPLTNGYLTTQVYALSAGPGNQILSGFQDNGTWLTVNDDPEDDWTLPLGGDGAYNDFNSDGTSRYMSSQNGNVYRVAFSNADDQTPNSYIAFPPDEYESELFIAPFYLDPLNDNIFYLGGSDSLYVNTQANTGNSNTGWKSIGFTGIEGVVSEFGLIGNGDVYVGTSGGQIFKIQNAQTNADSVINISDTTFLGSYISGIGVNSQNPDEIILCVSNYNVLSIFHTVDGGVNWTSVSGNLEENPDGSGSGPSARIVRILGDGELYLVGTSVGLFTTAELNGVNTEWVQEDIDGLGAVVVEHLDVRDSDGQILAGTHGNGIFSANLPLYPVDLALTAITSPVTSTTTGSEEIHITIKNLGFEAQSDFTLSYSVNGEVQETIDPSISIAPDEEVEFVFETAFDFGLGEFEVSANLDVPNDANPDNNQNSKTISKVALLSTFPYQESFETNDHGWEVNELWELGLPSQDTVNGASDGKRAWATDLNENYPDNTTAFLMSPVFDFGDLNLPFVSMDLNYNIEDTWDGAILAYRTDINNDKFKFVPHQAGVSNWYNDISQAIGNLAWTGNSNGYRKATANLSFLAGEPVVQLALIFVSDEAVTDEGIAMDNFELFESTFSLTDNTVPEESGTGTVVGEFLGSSGYELVTGEGSNDNESFIIDENVLKTAEVFDFETKDTYFIRVAAEDQQAIAFEISVLDQHEGPQNLELSNTKIPSDQEPGDVIGEFTVDDINDDEITYSLVEGQGDDDNMNFSIMDDQLLTDGLEINNVSDQFTIRVEAQDATGAFTVEPFVLTVEEVLGLINLARKGISIFPNPVNDFLHLKINNERFGEMSMNVFTLEGKLLFHQNWDKQSSLIKDRLDFSKLKAGTYVISFNLDGQLVSGKLVKR